MSKELQGLDPRLRRLLDKAIPFTFEQESELSALVLAHSRLDEARLEKSGATHIVRLTEHIWSVRFERSRLTDLNSLAEVTYIELGKQLTPMLTRSIPSIKALPEHIGEGIDGRDVVVGIVDYGIDWTLRDFCDETGTRTRIKYLWDQSLIPVDTEAAPADFDHGVEYTEQHINQALEAQRDGEPERALRIVRHRPWPLRKEDSTDTDGHGTHVTGIACGNGASSSATCATCWRPPSSRGYIGVAPRAWIVFVHLSRKEILGEVGTRDGSLANSPELAEAIAYCYRKADALSDQLGKRVPCVVNLSMGFNGGSHDGESLVERLIDTMMEGRGRALVVAAGNQRRQRTYFTAAVKHDTPYQLSWRMGLGATADTTLNEMEIWYSSRYALNVSLIDPAGRRSTVVEPGQRQGVSFGDITGIINSERFTVLNSEARIYLQLSPGQHDQLKDRWIVELTAAPPHGDAAGAGPGLTSRLMHGSKRKPE